MLKIYWALAVTHAAIFVIAVQASSNSSTSGVVERSEERQHGLHVPWVTPVVMRAMAGYIPSGEHEQGLCTKHGKIYAEHLANLTYWAVKMYDSSSLGASPGLMEGRNYEYGHFDECVSAESMEYGITGKYMMARLVFYPQQDLVPPFNESLLEWKDPSSEESAWFAVKPTRDRRISARNMLNWAICVPASCSTSDIEWSLRRILYPALEAEKITGNVTIFTEYTYSRATASFQPGISFYVFISIAGALLVTVILSTFRDVITPEEMKKPWYNDFSLRKNYNDLINVRPNELAAMSGMKVLSMFAIIYGHRMLISLAEPQFNPKLIQLSVGDFFSTFLENGTIVVNTFMTITGFLTFYKITKDVNSNRDLNVMKSILNRWLRLTPAYLAVMVVNYYTLPNLEGGPMSRTVVWDASTFGRYWWTHLLYINNYVYSEYQVLVPSWYMAFDIQMFIFSYLLGALLQKKWKLTPYVLTFAVILSLIAPVIVIVTHEGYSAVYRIHHQKPFNYLEDPEFRHMYIPTHARAAPYVIGMFAGYIYYYIKKRGVSWSSWSVYVWSILAGIAQFMSENGAWIFFKPARDYFLWEHIAYTILHRLCWAVPVCWWIFATSIVKNKLLKVSLCGSAYEVLNKLNYSALLVHSVIQLWLFGYVRSPDNYGRIVGLWMGCGDVVFSYVTAAVVYLLVEAPFSTLQRRITFLNPPVARKEEPNTK